jgi:hypothetical protein
VKPPFFKKTEALIKKAAGILRKRGVTCVTFAWSDLGDIYHVHGVNASATHLADALERRSKS